MTGTANAAPTQVFGGHLDWGVKQSFRNYITGPIAHDPDAGGLVTFTGSIRFTGHDSGAGPLLDLTISGPRSGSRTAPRRCCSTCAAKAWSPASSWKSTAPSSRR